MRTYIKLLGLFFLLVACEKEENTTNIELDKQINFNLSLPTAIPYGRNYLYYDSLWSDPYRFYGCCLKNFNKSNYVDIESIVICVPIYISSFDTKCYVDLFNLTDSVSIEDSQIETNSLSIIYVTSSNLIEKMPNRTIDLALRIRSDKSGFGVGVSQNSYLFLNR